MKKFINIAFIYALSAMAAGVFFREATRMLNYTDRTYLSLAHGHLFMLGTLFFLVVALLSKFIDFAETSSFRKAFVVYNIGLVWTVVLFLVHGWMQLQGMEVGAMIAGIAGLGHILWGIGLVWILNLIRSRA
ncbi:DUF2871 domain-containing protein [Holdemania massiliensis]|uniref:DUF2871 domain-containing protein n=1 Tax=Holdemania massiliensis TaxID=1468449 RepID=UPI0002FC0489|nr:DUF2871 domain-containing protein [Holdemania massiliensis]